MSASSGFFFGCGLVSVFTYASLSGMAMTKLAPVTDQETCENAASAMNEYFAESKSADKMRCDTVEGQPILVLENH